MLKQSLVDADPFQRLGAPCWQRPACVTHFHLEPNCYACQENARRDAYEAVKTQVAIEWPDLACFYCKRSNDACECD